MEGIRRAGKSFFTYQRIQGELLHDGHTWNEMLYVNFEDERSIGNDGGRFKSYTGSTCRDVNRQPMLSLDEMSEY